MKRQAYFPRLLADRPEWYHQYAAGVLDHGPGLGFTNPEIAATVADALFLEYVNGPWLTAVRDFGPAGTSALAQLEAGTGGAALALPGFVAPPLPAASAPFPAVVPVAPGAQDRVFKFAQAIKAKPAYTETIGLQLRIVGQQDASSNPLPTFTLKVERQAGVQMVKVSFKKYGQPGVAIWGKRGNGAWELLAIVLTSPYTDERPLLVPTAPEVRDYRLQFYDGHSPVGDFTDVASATVTP